MQIEIQNLQAQNLKFEETEKSAGEKINLLSIEIEETRTLIEKYKVEIEIHIKKIAEVELLLETEKNSNAEKTHVTELLIKDQRRKSCELETEISKLTQTKFDLEEKISNYKLQLELKCQSYRSNQEIYKAQLTESREKALEAIKLLQSVTEIPEIDLICCQESALIVEESIIVAHKIVTTETVDTETVKTETTEECLSTSSSSSDNQSK